MKSFFKYLLAVGVLTGFIARSQSLKPDRVVATITASATVVGNVDLIVMKDLDFQLSGLSSTELMVDPQSNSQSGEIRIVGSPNSLVRVMYEKESILRREGVGTQLFFTYSLSGGPSVLQSQSTLLTMNNQIRLSDKGVYYLWVGGRLSGVENIMPGNYDMELTLDLEYIQ